MTTLTATQVAALPRVNLLPPEIEEARRLRRLQVGLGAGVLASLGVVAALLVAANGQVSSAQDELATAKSEATQLQNSAAKYSEVPAVYAQVDAARVQLELAMGKEIRWSYFLNDLSLKIPSNVWLTSMTVTPTAADAAAAAAATAVPGATTTYLLPGIGNVAFEGKAMKHNNVAAWLDSLAKQQGYDQAYFSDSTKEDITGQTVVRFTSKVTITDKALSKRWVQKAGS